MRVVPQAKLIAMMSLYKPCNAAWLRPGVSLGTLLSANVADLTLTGNGGSPVVVLKNAGIIEHGYAFGTEPLRQGEIAWTTTRGFTAGAPDAVASVE